MTALAFMQPARVHLFLVVLVLVSGGVYAYSNPYEDPNTHDGAFCIYCHAKYAEAINNSQVTSMLPCYKKPCHYGAPEKGGNRYQAHLNGRVCKNCHSTINGEYDIHSIHRNEVSCKICHMSPRGWNSSIVVIPATPKKTAVYEETTIFVPDSECGYCHLSVIGATRIHDFHGRILTNNHSCVVCHGEVILARPDLIASILNMQTTGGMKKQELIPIKEFSRLFDDIAKSFLALVVIG